MNPTRGRHDTRKKGVCGALPVGVCLAVPCHLGECCGLEELVDLENATRKASSIKFLREIKNQKRLNCVVKDKLLMWIKLIELD